MDILTELDIVLLSLDQKEFFSKTHNKRVRVDKNMVWSRTPENKIITVDIINTVEKADTLKVELWDDFINTPCRTAFI